MKLPLLTTETMSIKGQELLDQIKDDFIGLDTTYTTVNGKKSRRIYLDTTASSLMMGVAHRASNEFLKHYSNTHSLLHFSAKISTKTYNWIFFFIQINYFNRSLGYRIKWFNTYIF